MGILTALLWRTSLANGFCINIYSLSGLFFPSLKHFHTSLLPLPLPLFLPFLLFLLSLFFFLSFLPSLGAVCGTLIAAVSPLGGYWNSPLIYLHYNASHQEGHTLLVYFPGQSSEQFSIRTIGHSFFQCSFWPHGRLWLERRERREIKCVCSGCFCMCSWEGATASFSWEAVIGRRWFFFFWQKIQSEIAQAQ